jgi:hypothetical protein
MYGDLPEVELTAMIDGVETAKRVNGYPVQIQNPHKLCVLRLPLPAELVKYLNAQKTITVSLPGGATETMDPDTPQADENLFTALRIDKAGEPFDEAEMAHAINKITTIRIDDISREDDNYTVLLSAVGGQTTHVISIPLHRDQAEFRRLVYRPKNLPGGKVEQRFPIEVPVKLYDKILVSSSGYAEGVPVPPHHKRAVVNALMSELNKLDSVLDPN